MALATAPDTSRLNVQRRLTELGRIRLGDKGSKGQPQKLTKFRLTSASRPLLEAAARVYGGTVRAWQGAPDDGYWELYTTTDALDIMVPPVMNAYSQLYEIWDAGGCTLRCDGAWESIAGEPCTHGDHEGMQVTTRVSVILPKLPGLGTWRLDTKGWNAAATLPAALDMLLASGRTVGWVPAILRLEQQSSRKKLTDAAGRPELDARGKQRSQTFRYVVPIIDILGLTFGELLAGGAADARLIEAGDALPAHELTPGPHRPPRGTKVERPALGPAPALPATSDFRKPTEPAAPVAAPEIVSGWAVEGGGIASDGPGAQAPADAPNHTTDEAGAAAGHGAGDDAAPWASAGDGEPELLEKLRTNAEASGLQGPAQQPAKDALAALFAGLDWRTEVRPVLVEAFGDGAARALSAAQANAITALANSIGDDAFLTEWRARIAGAGQA